MGKQMRQLDMSIRESLAALRALRDDSSRVTAWETLQERDGNGTVKGPMPYTDAAISQYESAYRHNPDDPRLVHHLAIAHHARAWDYELQEDPRASAEWERALGYWRKVGASSEFWTDLDAKLHQLDAKADSKIISDIRQNLLENLLDIHVDFIRHYCEMDRFDRALVHLAIVDRASIPPAVKKRLIDKVYAAMTGSVAEARAAGATESALATLERFLKLYPDHMNALRAYATICAEAITPLSHRDRWDDIAHMADLAEPHMKRLAGSPELASAPLAATALQELASEFAVRGRGRGLSFVDADETANENPAQMESCIEAFRFAVAWGRLGLNCGTSPDYAAICAVSLNGLAAVLFAKAQFLWGNQDGDWDTVKDNCMAALPLFQEARQLLEEAVTLDPEDQTLRANLGTLQEATAAREHQARMLGLLP